MNKVAEDTLSKVPAVTLGFWIIKIFATTLGETGGDAVTMTLHLGYLVGTVIFATVLVIAVSAHFGKAVPPVPVLGGDRRHDNRWHHTG